MAKAIAIKIDESLFREIHVKAAQKGFSTQQYVTELIKKNLFRSVKIGNQLRISKASFDEWLDEG